jgi:hypothetical protein
MDELRQIDRVAKPRQVYLVCDAMTGQDAVNSAKAFNEALELDGVILTKMDGDARGGAALSIRHITGKPIKFLGVGEKTTALEPFYPERLASRILDMGDVISLVEEVQRKVDHEEAARLVQKLKKGGFDLADFRDQAVVISGDTPSSISIGTTTGAMALHLAEAEPIRRSSPDDIPSKETSSNGLGRSSPLRASAPLTASTGPRFDHAKRATKWAAKKASTI